MGAQPCQSLRSFPTPTPPLALSSATVLQPILARPPLSAKSIRKWRKKREAWLRTLRPESLFYTLFDDIPDVYFFAKDAEGHTMFVSNGILARYRMAQETEMLGLTDYDINPPSMAETYIEEDRRLLAGKTTRIQRIELWFDEQGTPDWFVATKIALLDRKGTPVGVMGMLRRPNQPMGRLPVFESVARAVDYIRANYASNLLIGNLARHCGQSERQLQRRFHTAFGITPKEFLLKTRVVAAARLLQDTGLSLADIATQCGFIDQSAFSQQFRERTGSTPMEYRRTVLPQRLNHRKKAGTGHATKRSKEVSSRPREQ